MSVVLAMAPRPEPSDEQLREMWAAVARPEWGTYHDAKLATLRMALVRSRARIAASGVSLQAASGRDRYEPPAQPLALVTGEREDTAAHPAHPAHWGSLRVPRQAPMLDHKRAAAGERDDD